MTCAELGRSVARGTTKALLLSVLALGGCSGEVSGGNGSEVVLPPGQQAPNATAGTGGAQVAGDPQGNAGTGPIGNADACLTAALDTGEAPLRRLSRQEYAMTLQQLFQLPVPPDVEAVPPEAERSGFTVHTALQTMSAQHLRAYLEVATGLADELLADPARIASVVGCGLVDSGCLDSFVTRFGRMAFRRPLSQEELGEITQAARDNALDETDQYRYAIEVLLVSPDFLYRPEVGAGGAELVELSGYELASRLSFSLVGHAPSEMLLQMAQDGRLGTVEGRAQAVDMLVAQPAFHALYMRFFEEWLGFRRLISPKEPPPDWDDGLLLDMQAETAAVLERFAWGGAGFLDVLSANQTSLTPALADFYDLPEPATDGWVAIPAGHPRANTGLLTHASLLSQKSDGDRIAKRGNWLRRTFLCRNLEIPEEIAAELGERLVGLTHTQIVRERNTDPVCKGCHAAIDPIGVGLDGFDATGRFDPGYVVPDYGVMPALPDAPEPSFASVAELTSKLQGLPQVASCLTERTFLFVHGREPEARDACTVAAAEEAFVESGYDFGALVQGLLDAPAFGWRRTPALAQGGQP